MGFLISRNTELMQAELSLKGTLAAGATMGGLVGFMMFLSATIRPLPQSTQDSLETRRVLLASLWLPPIGAALGTGVGILLWLWHITGARWTPETFQPYAGAIVGGLGTATVTLGVLTWKRRMTKPENRNAIARGAAGADEALAGQTEDNVEVLTELRDEIAARRFVSVMNQNPRFQVMTAEEKVYLIRWGGRANGWVSRGGKVGLISGLSGLLAGNGIDGFVALKSILGIKDPRITTPAELVDNDDKFAIHGSIYDDETGLALASRLAGDAPTASEDNSK